VLTTVVAPAIIPVVAPVVTPELVKEDQRRKLGECQLLYPGDYRYKTDIQARVSRRAVGGEVWCPPYKLWVEMVFRCMVKKAA
jgi:hypothetical protein